MIDYWTEQQRLADEHEAYRGSQLHDFFCEFDRADSDPSWLAEREHELNITPQEWQSYREAKEQREQERYNAHPFIKSVLGDRDIMEAL
jgi:hypothetical protein